MRGKMAGFRGVWTAGFLLGMAMMAAAGGAQQKAAAPGAGPGQQPAPNQQGKNAPEKRITPEEAKKLFASVDELTKFASEETGLPQAHEIKRTLTSRTDVEKYLLDKFNDDEDAKRMQRGEIVLKKFGLLDRDFNLKPFMLALLKEQIAGYYDSKTKTVYMLDWLDAEAQKPVLAHELTHALQDQHTDLEKWSDQTPDDVSHNADEDNDHLAKDELDTARTAVLEGQAMAVFVDYSLKPSGKSLVKDPEVLDQIENSMQGSDDSPVMARAPLLLSESLIFPYRDGLSFEQDVWMDKGKKPAFTGVLDRPPSSSWEVMNPRMYEQGKAAPVLVLPNIHPLVDKDWKAYDIGQVGQLDLKILAQIFGGEAAARQLTPAWDGGIYWAGQSAAAKTPAELGSTKSVALMYLSAWKSEGSAQAFARMYAEQLGRKYSGVKSVSLDKDKSAAPDADRQQGAVDSVYTTDEGPVLIRVQGKFVFVSESFPLPLGKKLASFVIDGQGTGEIRTASLPVGGNLTGRWGNFMGSFGMLKVGLKAGNRE